MRLINNGEKCSYIFLKIDRKKIGQKFCKKICVRYRQKKPKIIKLNILTMLISREIVNNLS